MRRRAEAATTGRILALALLAGCGGRATEAPPPRPLEEPWAGSFSPRPSPTAEAVAEVNGEVIWDVEVAAFARERGLEARAALDELIALELLAQEARRRGLADDPEVVAVRRRERVRRLIDGFAAATDEPAEIPAAEVDAVWKRPEVQRFLNHGEIHDAGFIRVKVDKRATLSQVEAARALAEEIRARALAARPATYAEFKRLASELHVARLGKPVPTSEEPFPVDALVAADESFKQTALGMRTPGEISPVIRTRWGWDVLFLVRVRPARSTTRAQADAELRGKLWPDWRPQAFRRWLDELGAGARVARRDDVLDRVEVDSTFGLP